MEGIGRALMFVSMCLLVLSIVLSVKSFTGYVITEVVDEGSNFLSSGFFLLGISGSWYFFRHFKK
tara:strand:- start:176 stop:370 length:195 start_codon:yes stop_codon:yes gene_type:complete